MTDYDNFDDYNDNNYLYLVALNGQIEEGLLQHLLMEFICSHGPVSRLAAVTSSKVGRLLNNVLGGTRIYRQYRNETALSPDTFISSPFPRYIYGTYRLTTKYEGSKQTSFNPWFKN